MPKELLRSSRNSLEKMVIEEIENKKEWENFVLSQSPNIFLQSWHWGEFHQSLGQKIFRLGLVRNGEIKGVALLVKEEAMRGTYLACPGGPLLVNWRKENLKQIIDEIKKIGQEEKAVFIRARPSILDNQESRELFQELGFRSAPMHMHAETTWQLNLASSEDELLANMRKTTRYSIRRAARDGVKISQSKNAKDIEILYQLQMEAVKRHKFVPFSKEFMEKQFQAFVQDDQASLFLAEYKKQILSAAMIIYYGDMAVYHYAGTSSRFPKVFSSYLLQWEAIKEAKRRGCKIYNFWGIAPADDPKHRFAGVTIFKRGFGGERVDYLHAQDYALSPFYRITYWFETARRKIRRL